MANDAHAKNVIIEFDREAYDSEYEKTYWSSLHFVFCIAADTLKYLKSMDSLYLNTGMSWRMTMNAGKRPLNG